MSPRTLGGLGAVVAALAVSPLLEEPASRSFTWHMLQHQALVLVAGPLLGLALGEAVTRRHGRPPARVLHGLLVLAGLVGVGTLLLWHVPPAYDAATSHAPLHGIEHLTLLGSATLLWGGLWAARVTELHPGTSLVALVGIGLASAGLGVVLLMAPEPLYRTYLADPQALTDQRVGGALMKVGGLVLHAGAAVWLTVTWLSSLDGRGRRTAGRPAVPVRR